MSNTAPVSHSSFGMSKHVNYFYNRDSYSRLTLNGPPILCPRYLHEESQGPKLMTLGCFCAWDNEDYTLFTPKWGESVGPGITDSNLHFIPYHCNNSSKCSDIYHRLQAGARRAWLVEPLHPRHIALWLELECGHNTRVSGLSWQITLFCTRWHWSGSWTWHAALKLVPQSYLCTVLSASSAVRESEFTILTTA